MSNAWVIYPEVGDSPGKPGLIPDVVGVSNGILIKDGDLLDLSLQGEPASH